MNPQQLETWLSKPDIISTVKWWLEELKVDAQLYGTELDVRIGLDLRINPPKLRFMDGAVDYDLAHYAHCAAGEVEGFTDVDSLAADLLNQLKEQVHE